MPYTNTVTLLDTEGGEALDADVTARLWMLWFVHGTGTGTGNLQDERESQNLKVRKDLSAPATISFNQDADFSSSSRLAGISLQDTNRVAQDVGWLFRSGASVAAVSTEPIEIVTGRVDITSADLPGLLPSLPISIDSDTNITAVSLSLAASGGGRPAGVDFTATGATTKTGDTVGLTYTGRLVFTPSSDIAAADREALFVGIDSPALSFMGGATVASAIEAAVLNVLSGFILREFGPQIREQVERRINEGVIASAGRSLPGGVLPTGVNISVRTIDVNTARIQVRGALGAFGGVFSKLPPPPGGNGGTKTCGFQALAALGHSVTGMTLLREVRDTRLAATETGRRLIQCYYECGAEVSELLRADSELARRAAGAANELAAALRAGGSVPAELRTRAEDVLRDIADAGSPRLRGAVAYALAARPWSLV
jgi:hypothetical protein